MRITLIGIPSPLTFNVKYIITDTLPDASYDSIKTEVLRRNSKSSEICFRILLEDELLTNFWWGRISIEFLRWIRELADSSTRENSSMKKVFFSQLLSNVQSILAPMKECSSLEQIATSVDKILRFSRSTSSADNILAMTSSTGTQDSSSTTVAS